MPKGRTVKGKLYKIVVMRKMKNYYKNRRPKTGLKYVRLLHDNAPAHIARIVTAFWSQRRLPSFRTLRIRKTWPPVTFFSFQNLKTYAAISNAHLSRVCKRGKLSGSCLSTLNGFGTTQLSISLCHIGVPTFSSQNN